MVRKAKKLLRRKGCTKMRVLVQGSFKRLMEYYYLSYLKKPAIRVSNTLAEFSSSHPCVHVMLTSYLLNGHEKAFDFEDERELVLVERK